MRSTCRSRFLSVLLAAAAPVAATTEDAKLVLPNALAGDWAGRAVALDGDTAVVGAPYHDGVDSSSGSVHVFVRAAGTWSAQGELLPSDASQGDQFGHAVAIDAGRIAVGAPLAGDAGSVYVFVRIGSAWVEEARLVSPSPGFPTLFGWSVAL